MHCLSFLPLLPSLPFPEGPKGNKPLKSIHKNVFNCHWIPCGSSWMDKDWKGGCGRKNSTGKKLNTAQRVLNRSISWAKHRLSIAGQGTHSSETNLCYQPSSGSLLSDNTGRPSLHTVPQLCINSILPLWRAANPVMITKEPLLNTEKLLMDKNRNTVQPRAPLGKSLAPQVSSYLSNLQVLEIISDHESTD